MERRQESEMWERKVAVLFLWVLFAVCMRLNVEAKPSSTLERQIEAKLKQLNKPAVKTIKVCNHNTLSLFLVHFLFHILCYLNIFVICC